MRHISGFLTPSAYINRLFTRKLFFYAAGFHEIQRSSATFRGSSRLSSPASEFNGGSILHN